MSTKDVEKNQSHFSIENEVSKIKIYVPFTELLKNVEYKRQIDQVLKVDDATSESFKLQYDHPNFFFGPHVEYS